MILMDDDRAALITAGYKNMGLFISRELSKNGYTPILTYRSDEEVANRVAKDLGGYAFKADLENPDDVGSLYEAVEDHGLEVEALVNNASSFIKGSILENNISDIKRGIEGCMYPTLYPIKTFLPGMIRRGSGRIINIGMAGIQRLRPYSAVSIHAAAKTALLSITRSLAFELRDTGVTANMVSPGIIDRELYGEGERSPEGIDKEDMVSPDDVADRIIEIIEDPLINGEHIEIGEDLHT